MDIVGTIITGLVSAGVGLALGTIGLVLLRKRLARMAVETVTEYFNNPEIDTAIRTRIEQEFWKYAETALRYIHDHPKEIQPVLTGLLTDLSKALPKEAVGGIVSNALGDAAGEAAGSGAILQFVPRKWRGPVALLQMFLKGSGDTEKKSETTTFG